MANPSRDLILAAHQEATREWWVEQRPHYHCVTSDEAIREASLGDLDMSRRRLEALANPQLQKQMRSFMVAHGLTLPEICTPIELAEY